MKNKRRTGKHLKMHANVVNKKSPEKIKFISLRRNDSSNQKIIKALERDMLTNYLARIPAYEVPADFWDPSKDIILMHDHIERKVSIGIDLVLKTMDVCDDIKFKIYSPDHCLYIHITRNVEGMNVVNCYDYVGELNMVMVYLYGLSNISDGVLELREVPELWYLHTSKMSDSRAVQMIMDYAKTHNRLRILQKTLNMYLRDPSVPLSIIDHIPCELDVYKFIITYHKSSLNVTLEKGECDYLEYNTLVILLMISQRN